MISFSRASTQSRGEGLSTSKASTRSKGERISIPESRTLPQTEIVSTPTASPPDHARGSRAQSVVVGSPSLLFGLFLVVAPLASDDVVKGQ